MTKRKRYTYGYQTPRGVRKYSAIYKNPVKPRGKGCLCEDGSYSSDCCDGSIQGQGIGDLTPCGTYILNQGDYVDCGYTE